MNTKSKEVTEFLQLVDHTFGTKTLEVVDHWDDETAVGLQKANKLLYVDIDCNGLCFYECEFLVDDPEIVYNAGNSENNITQQNMIKVIKDFFNIE